ncbi:MAG: hypothetical protein Edafosvirus9_12 [Edafosvirus sp.]|uniref:Uncharacterized protein n=1 Tax=Edafosvirus sp. TaxID=2487765 RepID=A0A3G4ZTS8_9VIRU|nr:MAG: hypothetical protein Edafosvirus9_12 [Edafosvirus sp.]
MEDTHKSLIILIQGNSTTELTNKLNGKKITIVDLKTFYENASDQSFNESKFFGTICILVADGKIVAITNAQEYVSSKGNLSLLYALTTRIKGTSNSNYQFVSIFQPEYINGLTTKEEIKNTATNESKKGGNKKNEPVNKNDMFYKWSEKNSTIVPFDKLDSHEFKENQPIKSELKVTCGLLCNYETLNSGPHRTIAYGPPEGPITIMPNYTTTYGHRTIAYGVSCEEAKKLEEENKSYIGKKYDSKLISLTVNEKAGGHVVVIPELGVTAHVTVNTVIQSSLSGPIVEKLNSNTLEFKLSDINPKLNNPEKTDKNLAIKETGGTIVNVTGWYCYAVENK